MRSTVFALVPVLAASALAQTPIPQTAPRAHWVASAIAVQLPVQVRETQGAASLDKMYVFGGRDGNAGTITHNALYEFDGTAWVLKTADDAVGSPPRRGGSAVAWNFATNKLVVFGGNSGTSLSPAVMYGDTWEWDPITNTWADVTPAAPNPSPSPRQLLTMTWEPVTGGMLLFGGNSGAVEGDTWLFLGGAWIQVGVPGPGTPTPRQQSSLVTRSNPEFRDVMMVGGQGGGVHFLDAWRWDVGASAWVLITPTSAVIPPAVVANQGVYDPLRKRIVLQGGNGIPTAQVPGYNAQPSGWCGEFDCVTNEWFLYGGATPGTGDPVIGKCSRYYAAFVPALGKVYKVSGQANTTAMAMATYEYQATPVAAATATVPTCIGPAGTVTLAADNDPWMGRTFSMTTSNVAAGSLSFGVLGFGVASLPLSAVHPAGLPGCDVLLSLDHITPFLPQVGTSTTFAIAIPSNPAFAGIVLRAQTIAMGFDPSFQITSLTSSNRVDATIGAL